MFSREKLDAVVFWSPRPGELSIVLSGTRFFEVEQVLAEPGVVIDNAQLLEPILGVLGSDQSARVIVQPDRITVRHKAPGSYGSLLSELMHALWDNGFKPTFTYV